MHYIKIFIYKNILHNYGKKDVKGVLRGNWVLIMLMHVLRARLDWLIKIASNKKNKK